jgi:hypothetical protein
MLEPHGFGLRQDAGSIPIKIDLVCTIVDERERPSFRIIKIQVGALNNY